MSEKDYSLLRQFDLEAAKRGDPVCLPDGAPVAYVAGPNRLNTVVCQWRDEQFKLANRGQLRMAPLCWVEDKPVYKGDVLWHIRRGRIVASHMIDGKFLCEEGIDSGDRVENLTWTPPRVKREGWVNIYPKPTEELVASVSHAHASKEKADSLAASGRIACIRIEWEEPAREKGNEE